MTVSSWGPIHSCAKCGAPVIYCFDPRWRASRLYEAGAHHRHVCPNVSMSPSIDFRECFCGGNVDIVGEIRYDRGTDQVHVCVYTPAKPRPERREAMAPLPNVDRIPRGAIIL